MRSWKSVACSAAVLWGLVGLVAAGAGAEESAKSSRALRSLEKVSEALANGRPKVARLKLEPLSFSSLQRQETTDSLLRVLGEARGYVKEKPKATAARILVCQVKSALGTRLQEEVDAPRALGPSSGGGLEPPKRLYDPQVWNPASAWRSGAEGVVISQLVIDTDGCVASYKLLRGVHPDLDASAQRTLLIWVYRPATLDGLPIAVYRNISINFANPQEGLVGY